MSDKPRRQERMVPALPRMHHRVDDRATAGECEAPSSEVVALGILIRLITRNSRIVGHSETEASCAGRFQTWTVELSVHLSRLDKIRSAAHIARREVAGVLPFGNLNFRNPP